MKIQDKVIYILANYPETRDSIDKLETTYKALYSPSSGELRTVDRVRRLVQNTLGLYPPCEEEIKKRSKHARKISDTFRSSLETNIVKMENKQYNLTLTQ